MRQILLYVILFLFVVQSRAQQKVVDSLQEVLQSQNDLDTLRLQTLNELASVYCSLSPTEGIKNADNAIALASTLKAFDALAEAYLNKGLNYLALGEHGLAKKLFYKSLDLSVSNNNIEGHASALYGIAQVYQNQSEYNKAIEHYTKAAELFDAIGNQKRRIKTLNGIGTCQMYSSNYTKALEAYLEVLRFYEGNNQLKANGYGDVLNNIGLIYSRMETKQKLALDYLQRALEVYKYHDYKLGMGNLLGNMANVYDNMGEPEKAIELQKESYNIQKSIENKLGMANALTNIGIAYSSLDAYDKTIYYLKQTLPIYEELGNMNNLSIVQSYLGEALLELAHRTKNYGEAENFLHKAYETARAIGNLRTQADSYNLLSQLHATKGDYKKALEFKEGATVLLDSLNSEDLRNEITRLEVKYEYDKEAEKVKQEHEKAQALAEAEISRQRIIQKGAVFGGGLLFAVTIFGLVIYKRKRDAVAQKQVAEFKMMTSDIELKALRAQMNPHFIFNTLNSIVDYISKNETEAAKDYLVKFSKIIRQTLENSTQKSILLEDDLKLLELYIEMEMLRLKNKLTYQIEVDQLIDAGNTLVPPMILQPFVENSIWHGISKKEGPGHISVQIKKDQGMLICTVEDDGIGIQESEMKGHNGKKLSLGQSITKKRIDILNKIHHTNGSVNVSNKTQGKGTRVEVILPIELAY